jgi:hypothetical protein
VLVIMAKMIRSHPLPELVPDGRQAQDLSKLSA